MSQSHKDHIQEKFENISSIDLKQAEPEKY